jgi:two-component system chemotaxis family response regulator WspR
MKGVEMGILIVEDSRDSAVLLKHILDKEGYTGVHAVHSAGAAFEYMGVGQTRSRHPEVDLVLLDILMPEIDGIKACRRIKEDPRLRDIPIIMVTATSSELNLEKAFEAGAIDFINKPFRNLELLARVRSALRLKQEIDRRKQRESELTQVNAELLKLSCQDGLTGVANRRHFDETMEMEWKRAIRNGRPLSLMMIDIDFFKNYNDHFGHIPGDECLKMVAETLGMCLRRPADFVTRYGGEEFAVILPETDLAGAAKLAEEMRKAVESRSVAHPRSVAAPVVTISAGAACIAPERGETGNMQNLIAMADGALLQAKRQGRNRVVTVG